MDELRAKARKQNVDKVTGNYNKPETTDEQERPASSTQVDAEDMDRAASVQRNMLAEVHLLMATR